MSKPDGFDLDRYLRLLAEAKDEPKRLALIRPRLASYRRSSRGLSLESALAFTLMSEGRYRVVRGIACTRRQESPGEIFMNKRLSNRIIEEAGRRIYESQQARLSDQTTLAAKRAWRSEDVPIEFWDSYREDARAALSLTGVRMPTAKKDTNLADTQRGGHGSGRSEIARASAGSAGALSV